MRRRFLIQRGLQFRFAAIIFFTGLAITLIAGWTTYVTTWSIITQEFSDLEMQVKLSQISDKITFSFIYRGILALVLISFISIFISHRIAGPSYKLEKIMEEISYGKLGHNLRLRRRDALKSLASSIDTLERNLAFFIKGIKKQAYEISDISKRLSSNLSSKGASPDTLDKVKSLNRSIERLLKEISYFKA